MNDSYNRKILIVDDQPKILEDYEKILLPVYDEKSNKIASMEEDLFGDTKEAVQQSNRDNNKYTLVTANQGEKAIFLVKEAVKKKDPFAVAFIDVRMPPGIDGVHTASEIRKIDPRIEIIFVTAYSDFSRKEIIELMGASDIFYLRKPFDADEIRQLALALSEKWNLYYKLQKTEALLRQQNTALKQCVKEKYSFQNMVCGSDKIIEVVKKAKQVALTDATVLVYGETGTGKELIARAIHNNSPRASENFIAINCGAIPESLLESELFGHEKGAFTMAHERRIGRFEEANHGTIFLDEIGDMPFSLQIKLLRVLQENIIQHLGSNRDISLDIRVIAATHQNLPQLIKSGKFREDLYYRLKIFEVQIPPLRERKTDIPLLIDHFIKFYNKKYNKHILGINDTASYILNDYDFPGNVRELQHIIERAVIVCKRKMIAIHDLPKELSNLKPTMRNAIIDNGIFTIPKNNEELNAAKVKAKDTVERLFLRELLSSNSGNVSKAARKAGINRSWLAQLISKHQMDLNQFRKTGNF